VLEKEKKKKMKKRGRPKSLPLFLSIPGMIFKLHLSPGGQNNGVTGLE